ncbi:NAD(P)(+) transhydrogenase (Re/Si-specific) subunit beta [Rhodococcus hoagii]|nr:NAD(P)(+) transhydrogenase (Re/Si-specific) subunit beta [Prescottella equi]
MSYLVSILYIVAFAMFIYGLSGLTGPKTAVRGNYIAAVGMLIAVVAVLIDIRDTDHWGLIIGGLLVGIVLGVPPALRTKMTAMPQLVALFNGVGGGTVALIAWAEFLNSDGFTTVETVPSVPFIVGSLFAAIIGSVSFWGSLVAFAKLQELFNKNFEKKVVASAKAFQLANMILAVVSVGIAIYIGIQADPANDPTSALWIVGLLVAAGVMGLFVVLPIGGADMPVVISLLNALTGLSAAAAGLALNNQAMIVAGMIVGASGSILTNLMAKAMNRSIPRSSSARSVAVTPAARRRGVRRHRQGHVRVGCGDPDGVRQPGHRRPGYGLAVAQAQHAVKEMAALLEERGVEVKYAIHPVAGRMPGHMNVLLAEADVAYDAMKEMDDINGEFARTDVTVVIGANDVTNPAARNDSSSPIYGMPILNVDQSKSVIVLKRSMSSGYAGIDNPLFTADGTSMLFGDAKKMVSEVTEELKAL